MANSEVGVCLNSGTFGHRCCRLPTLEVMGVRYRLLFLTALKQLLCVTDLHTFQNSVFCISVICMATAYM
jgi:hypothetical protein